MANRYWVGGTGTWDATTTTHWSATSGGAGGATNPTSVDDVFIDANSGSPTVTFNNGVCLSLTTTGATCILDATVSSATGNLTIAGSMTLSSTTTWTAPGSAGTITFTASTTGNTITNSSSSVIQAGVTFNGTGSWGLGSALLLHTGFTAQNNFKLVSGTLNTNNFNITAESLNLSGSTVRTLNAGTSTLSTIGSAGNGYQWDASGTNLTLGGISSATLLISASGGSSLGFSGGGFSYGSVTLSPSSTNTWLMTGSNSFTSLTLAYHSSSTPFSHSFSANQTIGTLNFTGTPSAMAKIMLSSDVIGASRTLSITTATNTNYIDFRDIAISGVTISGTNIGSAGGNSGITPTTPKTVYKSALANDTLALTGSWATTSGGTGAAANMPMPQDIGIIDNNSSVFTVTGQTLNFWFGSIDASARTTAYSIPVPGGTFKFISIYGYLNLSSSVTTVSTTNSATGFALYNRSNQNLTISSSTINSPINFYNFGCTVTLAGSVNLGGAITIANGTLNANNQNVSCSSVTLAAGTKTVTMGSGLWTISGTGTVWDFSVSAGLTFNKNTANILLSNISTTARTFAGGGQIYNKLTIGGATGISTTTITGANTFSELASIKTVAHTITLPSSTTTSVGLWSITGTAGNIVTLNSSTPGTQATLSNTSGVESVSYMSIKDSNATGGAVWQSYLSNNNINNGNNSGWIFSTVVNQGSFLMFF